MSVLAELDKDPNAKLDYTIDWSAWLVADTIVSSLWIIGDGVTAGGGSEIESPPALIQCVTPAPSNTTTTCTIWLEGGTHLKEYKVTNRITTLAGRIDDRSFTLKTYEH